MSQGPGIEGATSLHTGGEEAGGRRSAGAGEWEGRREGVREEEREEGGKAGKMPLPGAGPDRDPGEGLQRRSMGAGAAVSLT